MSIFQGIVIDFYGEIEEVHENPHDFLSKASIKQVIFNASLMHYYCRNVVSYASVEIRQILG